jgi:nucleotide-binding universal stress UspA family protein
MDPKTLVVPLDGSEHSERALPVAQAIADRIGGGLVLVSAQFRGPLDPREYLEEQAARVSVCPVELHPTKHENSLVAISNVLNEAEDRVVCMSTHGRGSWRWAALGSVAEEVIKRTDRPVVLVGRHCRADFLARGSDLLVCADHADAAAAMAPTVRSWSAMLKLRTRVAVVVHPLDVPSAKHPELVLEPITQALGVSDPEAGILLRENYIAGGLVDCADDLPAALMAINTHARRGAQRLLLGSETMAVVHLAPCPVLVTHESESASAQ